MKQTYIQFRLNEDEKQRILQNMQLSGFRTLSDFARVVLLNYGVKNATAD